MENEARRKIVGVFLKGRREKAELTQQDVATQLSYASPQFISNWERGVSLPPMDILPKLATLYRIVPKDMIDVMYRYQEHALKLQKKELVNLFRRASPRG